MAIPSRTVISAGPTPVGPYSPAVAADGSIFVSGTLAQDPAGGIIGKGDAAVQTRRILERMGELLEAGGSSLSRVAAITVYLKSAADFQAMNGAYAAFWPDAPPTRTTVIAGLALPDALVEMSAIAVGAGADRTVVHPPHWLRSPSPYSYAVRTGDTLFLSGLVSRNGRDNSSVPGDVRAQTRVVMDNAGELLHAAGMTFADIVSARVFLPDAASFASMNDVYRGYFSMAPPARATVHAGLAGSQYNVEMTFVASAAERKAIDVGTPNPNLSAAILAGSRVYLSGMLGSTPATRTDVKAQTRETLARIARALDAAGCGPADVVDSLVYLTDLAGYPAMNEAYRTFFGASLPARTTVQSGLFDPDGVVEIMMTAVKP